MAAAAHTLRRSRRRVLPAKTAKGLRHLALRGTAITYLVMMVAIPFAAIIVMGFGGGLGTLLVTGAGGEVAGDEEQRGRIGHRAVVATHPDDEVDEADPTPLPNPGHGPGHLQFRLDA